MSDERKNPELPAAGPGNGPPGSGRHYRSGRNDMRPDERLLVELGEIFNREKAGNVKKPSAVDSERSAPPPFPEMQNNSMPQDAHSGDMDMDETARQERASRFRRNVERMVRSRSETHERQDPHFEGQRRPGPQPGEAGGMPPFQEPTPARSAPGRMDDAPVKLEEDPIGRLVLRELSGALPGWHQDAGRDETGGVRMPAAPASGTRIRRDTEHVPPVYTRPEEKIPHAQEQYQEQYHAEEPQESGPAIRLPPLPLFRHDHEADHARTGRDAGGRRGMPAFSGTAPVAEQRDPPARRPPGMHGFFPGSAHGSGDPNDDGGDIPASAVDRNNTYAVPEPVFPPGRIYDYVSGDAGAPDAYPASPLDFALGHTGQDMHSGPDAAADTGMDAGNVSGHAPPRPAVYHDTPQTDAQQQHAPDMALPVAEVDETAPPAMVAKKAPGFFRRHLGSVAILALMGGAAYYFYADRIGMDGTPPRILAQPGSWGEKPADADPLSVPLAENPVYDTISGNAGTGTDRVAEGGLVTPGDAMQLPASTQDATAVAPASGDVRTLVVRPDGTVLSASGNAVIPGSRIEPATPALVADQAGQADSIDNTPVDLSSLSPSTREIPAAQSAQTGSDGGIATTTVVTTTVVTPGSSATGETSAASTVEAVADLPPLPGIRPANLTQAGASVTSEAIPLQDVSDATPVVTQPVQEAGADGEYFIQLAAGRSDSAARTAYAGLQRRFPDLLSGLDPVVIKADLGERGVFYRVRIMYDGLDAATSMCGRIKEAGGECFARKR